MFDKHIQQLPLAHAHQDTHNVLSTTALSLTKDDDDIIDEKSLTIDEDQQKLLQMKIESMMNPPQPLSTPSSAGLFDAFDESKLPLPLFSSIVIFVVTTFLTGYMFYIGIMGFPENEVVPRIF
jgi:hypothetical protein